MFDVAEWKTGDSSGQPQTVLEWGVSKTALWPGAIRFPGVTPHSLAQGLVLPAPPATASEAWPGTSI